jgi:hypothetical protein
MSQIHKISNKSIFLLIICLLLLLTACGGNAEESVGERQAQAESSDQGIPTEQEIIDAVEQVQEIAENVEGMEELAGLLDTSVEMMETTPEPDAELPSLPSPNVIDGRSFRYSSLDITLDSWQLIDDTTSEGIVCERNSGDMAVALKVTMTNSAAMPFTLGSREMTVVDAVGEPVEFMYGGVLNSAKLGQLADIAFEPNETISDVLCVGISVNDDPNEFVWLLGEGNGREQVHVPLAAETAVSASHYAEVPAGDTFTFKGADFTIPQIIITSGVWGKYNGEGQAQVDHKWVLIPVEVVNNNNPNLFVEDDEVRLSFGNQTIAPVLDYYDPPYRLAPYGMESGTTAVGSALFEVPADVQEITLELNTTREGYTDDIQLTFDLTGQAPVMSAETEAQAASPELEEAAAAAAADLLLFADKLEACTEFSQTFIHPFVQTEMERTILGLVDGNCVYQETMPNDGLMECAYPPETVAAIAQYYRDLAAAESMGTEAELSGDGTQSATYTIDGQEVENPLQAVMNNSTCTISGY